MEDMNNELTIDYVADFLKGRGYDISERSEKSIMFRALAQDWWISIDPNGILALILVWAVEDVEDWQRFQGAVNATNEQCRLVKCILSLENSTDEDGNVRDDLENCRKLIYFICEQICTRKADFDKYFDIFIENVLAAADYHAKIYNEMLRLAKNEKGV